MTTGGEPRQRGARDGEVESAPPPPSFTNNNTGLKPTKLNVGSLGVTIFKLLCGKRPFDKKKFEKIRENREQQDKDKTNKDYEMLKQEIVYPSYFEREEKR